MRTSPCPVCNSDVVIEDGAYEHDLIECTNCNSELEIISLHPVQLREISQEDEQ